MRVYRAEGLPALRPGLLGSLAHALLDQRVPVDPYVRVSFLGQQVSPSHPHSAEAQARIRTDRSPPVFARRSRARRRCAVRPWRSSGTSS